MTEREYEFRKVKLNGSGVMYLVYGDDDHYYGHIEQPYGGWAFYDSLGHLSAVGTTRDDAVQNHFNRG